jgi:acyl carrier protein phosphodiesterase
MNFLAHAYLSGNREKLLVGNFIADFVKGRAALQQFDGEIKHGILLHRSIDAFTDSHPTVSLSKDRLRDRYRHYSSVIVDVFYDHFLAKNWRKYHPVPLEYYATDVYRIINENFDQLPMKVQEFFPFMQRGNWLLSYSKVEGIGRALTGMSRRTPYESRMDESVNDLIRYYDDFEKEFASFFPLLAEHVRQYLNSQNAE